MNKECQPPATPPATIRRANAAPRATPATTRGVWEYHPSRPADAGAATKGTSSSLLRRARAYCDECQHDFLITYSCTCRGVCPSCDTRRKVETTEHLGYKVFPPLPVRQRVLAVPKRLRYFLQQREAKSMAVVPR